MRASKTPSRHCPMLRAPYSRRSDDRRSHCFARSHSIVTSSASSIRLLRPWSFRTRSSFLHAARSARKTISLCFVNIALRASLRRTPAGTRLTPKSRLLGSCNCQSTWSSGQQLRNGLPFRRSTRRWHGSRIIIRPARNAVCKPICGHGCPAQRASPGSRRGQPCACRIPL